MLQKISNLWQNESAVTTVEYALLLAMIVLLAVASMIAAGDASSATFGACADAVKQAL